MPRVDTWVSLRITKDLHARITKAAAKNDQSVSRYIREGIEELLISRGEYSIKGPQKGNR